MGLGMVSKVRNKESPYVVGGRDKMSFNEFGVRRTGFYTILKLTLDDLKWKSSVMTPKA